jgi:hypothetical protein
MLLLIKKLDGDEMLIGGYIMHLELELELFGEEKFQNHDI